MENFEETKPVQQTNELAPLIVTEDIRSYIYETAKWTKFLSIMGFIFCGFIIIAAFTIPALMSTLGDSMGPGSAFAKVGGGFLTFIYLLMGLLYFYPSLLLFKYATAAKKAVLFGDQLSLGIAMSKMKSFFKFWGILTIIILALYAIIILFAVVAGIGAGMGS